MRTLFELDDLIAITHRAIQVAVSADYKAEQIRTLRGLQRERCEIIGHEYAMIYNDGTTCLNCGHHRGFGEESGIIRSVSGVEVPALLCDLARALPLPVCPPEHTIRENLNYCKACDESRDELQQLVGDGDLKAIAIVIGVYLRRLYTMYDLISSAVEELDGMRKTDRLFAMLSDDAPRLVELMHELDTHTGVLEMIFGEVLSDEDRNIPTDEEAARLVKEMIAPIPMGGEQK